MDDLDVATKVLLREDPLAMVRLVCPHLHVRRACLEPTERVRLHRFQDCLVRAYVQELGWVWFHFEAIARWRSSVPRATFEYWCLAWPTHRPLLSVVLVQKPDRRQARAPRARLTVRFGELEVARFRALTVPLWELPRSKLRAAPALLPLAVFSSKATPQTVEQVMRRLRQVRPAARRVELQVALALLAGNVFPGRDWVGTIPREILMKSTTYQQIQAEARAEATQELLAGLIRQRLPRQARRLIERLKACPPEVLARVAKRLFDEHVPRGDRELLAELEALLAD